MVARALVVVLLSACGAIATNAPPKATPSSSTPAPTKAPTSLSTNASTSGAIGKHEAPPEENIEPDPDVPVGKTLTAYVGPRFITNDRFVPQADVVLADETGRVRALLQGPPPKDVALVRLPGALAVSGLHDAHIHIEGVGRLHEGVELLGATSVADVRAKVDAWSKAHPHASVVEGRGWDQTRFAGQKWPTAHDLGDGDGRPVLLERVDGHAIWVNAKALRIAGVTKDTKDPEGGKIVRDDAGNPSGVLIDNAVNLVREKLPPPTAADQERWLVAGLNACANAGLVAVADMGMKVEAAQILAKLDDAGKLPVRVFVYLDGTDDASYAWLGRRKPTAMLKIVGVKLYADGALGSRGAALLDDYSDDQGNRGLLVTEPKLLEQRIARVHAKGFAAAVHAIGDRANRIVLDAMKKSPAPPGVRDWIEHAQIVAPADFQRFFDERVVASMQPTHATSDMRWVEQRLGPDRVKGAYAWRTMLDDGVHLAFGSDAPVESERPQLGIYAAVTRQDADGNPPGGFMPEQKLTEQETLKAFAVGAAWAVSEEQHLGALTPGMFFDVTLFTDDALAASVEKGDKKAWLNTKVAGTVVGATLRRVQ